MSAYEDNCLLRPVKTGRHSLKWTSELQSLRKGVFYWTYPEKTSVCNWVE
jgi:hypothetical protein